MIEIKDFITDFFKSEAIARYNRFKPDLAKYNDSLDEMHTYVVNELIGMMGIIKLNKLDDETFYERGKDTKPLNPRHLFKISHYLHSRYQDVWIVYTSETNPRLRFPVLSIALFVIKEKGEFKIARNYVYSNKGGMSTEYGWEGFSGYQDLTFESLGELIATERYLEPKDKRDALMLYNQEA